MQARFGECVLKSSCLYSLKPFLDNEGILRVGGRTGEHPIIIPYDSPIARVIVLHYHCSAHVGAEWTLALIRQEFWLVKGRSLVKRILRDCVTCKQLYAKPNTQMMANLPDERVQPGKPVFSCVGIDAFGPIIVKNYRSEIKRYGCIFTCMATRAIHIEMLHSLDTDSFLNGFRRFVSRRGFPEKVFSDNGGNFVAGEKELRQAMRDLSEPEIRSYATARNIEWHFNPPLAPHMGGAWERMIAVIKRVMRAVMSQCVRLTDEVLSTIFCEIENIVNGRPLTKLSGDPEDLRPLTPNHLLLMRQGPSLPPGKFNVNDMYRRRWRHAQHIAEQFWRRWTRLYLPELQRRVKWVNATRNLSVGDLVMIADENMPRNLWPLALVKEVITGRDGLVRTVRLRTRCAELVRPVTKVVLLEGAVN